MRVIFVTILYLRRYIYYKKIKIALPFAVCVPNQNAVEKEKTKWETIRWHDGLIGDGVSDTVKHIDVYEAPPQKKKNLHLDFQIYSLVCRVLSLLLPCG